MHAITWRPGTDPLLDPLFDYLRELQYRRTEHPLWKNYNRDHFFNECMAISIVFGNHNLPVFCGSILIRDCWPKNTYRIVNRFFATYMWDNTNLTQEEIANWSTSEAAPIAQVADEAGVLVKNQIEWLKENTDVDMVFISRESNYWQKWTVNRYTEQFGVDFKFNKNRYQVCATPDDDSCFQRIIYQGPDELLGQWNHK